jgi:hypothetical protein
LTQSNTIARSLHDVGLAAWFGGSLMGAVGLNGAAANLPDASQRVGTAADGWKRWAPVNAAAIGAHIVGGYLIVKANRGRIAGQRGVGSATGLKTGLTVAAVAATAAAGVLGAKIGQHPDVPTDGATEPSSETPQPVASAQRQLLLLQWAIPTLTGVMLGVSARMGEQQRPNQVASGLLTRLLPD